MENSEQEGSHACLFRITLGNTEHVALAELRGIALDVTRRSGAYA